MISKRDENGTMWGYSVVVVKGDGIDEENDADLAHSSGAVVDVVLDNSNRKRAEIPFCNDLFLRLMGFSDDVIENDRTSALATINLIFKNDIVSLIPSYEAEAPAVCYTHGFVHNAEGNYLEVSCWMRTFDQEGKTYHRLVVVPISQAAQQNRIKNKAEFLEAMRSVYDIVLDVDLLNKFARCIHNAIGGRSALPCDVTLGLNQILSDWAHKYLTDKDQELFCNDIKPLLEIRLQPASLVARHRTYTSLVHGQEMPIDVLIYRMDDYLLLMIKVLGDLDASPESAAGATAVSAAAATAAAQASEHQVCIRTFGYFEVFVDDKPIIFKHPKSRELFALLVDRRGGVVTSRAAASLLWDDKETDDTVMARYRKIAMYLAESLEEAGVGFLVENTKGNRRADLSKAQCDLIDYLNMGDKAPYPFSGVYMNEYSWAEQTLGELIYRSERL